MNNINNAAYVKGVAHVAKAAKEQDLEELEREDPELESARAAIRKNTKEHIHNNNNAGA